VRLPDQQAIKKALERQRVTELRALYPPFPHGALEDDEPPDFILRTDAGVIGIEVTGLYTAGGEVARATEGAWAGLLDGARKRYAAAGLPPVQVIAYWNARAPTTRRVTAALRNALATTVGRMVSASSGGFDTHIEYSGQRGVQLPEGIERLRVRRVHDAADGFWSFGQGGVVPVWSPDFLQGAIDRKDRLLDSYRQKCDRAWLILLADHSYASSWGEHSDASRQHVYATRFERVIVYRAMAAEVTELRLRAPASDRELPSIPT
jgi:hypothetical protein